MRIQYIDNNKPCAAKMAEGYQALDQEHKEFAAMACEIAHEVVPEWE